VETLEQYQARLTRTRYRFGERVKIRGSRHKTDWDTRLTTSHEVPEADRRAVRLRDLGTNNPWRHLGRGSKAARAGSAS
jgi:predicted nicotinamide N-methyase